MADGSLMHAVVDLVGTTIGRSELEAEQNAAAQAVAQGDR